MLTYLPLLCATQPLRCALWTSPPLQQQGGSLSGFRVADAGPGSSAHGGTISHEHPWEVIPDLCLYREPEEIEKEEQTAAKKAVTKEELQGEGTAPAPEFTAALPEVWSAQAPSMPVQQFPAGDWLAAPLRRPLNGRNNY